MIVQVSDLVTSANQPSHAWFSDGDGLEMALYIPTFICLVGAVLFFVCSAYLPEDRCVSNARNLSLN